MRRVRLLLLTVPLLLLSCLVRAVTSPMPYRPGYGLGSWIPPEVIQGMKVEAYARSGILLADQMVNDATSLARELQIAQNPVKNPLNSQQDIGVPLNADNYRTQMGRINTIRSDAWNMKITQYENLFAQMNTQLAELTTASKGDGKGTVKAFSTFASAVESPTIWETSKIDYVDRAFDSITVSSAFMDIETIQQFTRDSSSSEKESGTSSASFNDYFVSASYQASVAQAASKRLTEVYSLKSVETTLILSSFATHRMVKQFTTLNVDPDKLREAWNYWKKDDPIPHPVYEQGKFIQAFMQAAFGGDTTQDLENKISFVTEIFQGSALVGFVHFVKTESTRSSTSDTSSSSDFSSKGTLENKLWLSSITGTTSFSRDAAEKIASAASQSGLDIQFDLVCLGYVPNIKSQIIQTAVASLKSIDVNSQTTVRPGAAGQTEQQDNANSVIGGTLGALNKMVSDNPVLGVQTFMDAFDDYAQAAHSRPNEIGAPVGLNVKEYSKIDILGMLADTYLGPNAKRNAAPTASAAADNKSTPAAASSSDSDAPSS